MSVHLPPGGINEVGNYVESIIGEFEEDNELKMVETPPIKSIMKHGPNHAVNLESNELSSCREAKNEIEEENQDEDNESPLVGF